MSRSSYQTLNDFLKGQIIAYRNEGKSYRAIAAQLELKRSTVHSFMKKFTETKSYERKVGSGRKPKISDLKRRLITRAVKINPNATPASIKADNPQISMSDSTLRRVKVGSDLFERRAKRKIPLIIEKPQ